MRESYILLCKNIKLDKNYNNVLNYSENDMLTLCSDSSHLISRKNDYSFIRSSRNTISTDFTYSDALKSNYIAFQNKDYDNKWFFAFVDDVIYKSDSCTEIVYTIDIWSTWFNKLTINQCFIKREHTNDDTIGANTLDENLDIGDVICESSERLLNFGSFYYVILETNYIPKDGTVYFHGLPELNDTYTRFSSIGVHNKIVSGTCPLVFPVNYNSETQWLEDLKQIALFIYRASWDGHTDDIKNLYVLPIEFVGLLSSLDEHYAYASNDEDNNYKFTFYKIPYSKESFGLSYTRTKLSSFTGFTPKNNKVFCFPYNYLLITNNSSNQNIFKYENWYNSNDVKFRFDGVTTCGGSARIAPVDYKNMSGVDEDESIPMSKFPTFSWSSDAYINWLSKNGVDIATSILSIGIGVAGAVATGGASIPLQMGFQELAKSEEQRAMIQGKQNLSNLSSAFGLGTSLASQVGNLIGAFSKASMLPNIVGGQNTGDVKYSVESNTFILKKMRAKTENLRVIDDYFTKYGYKTNRVKTPNITGRTYFNYIEIGDDSSIGYGEIPQNALAVINSICKRGVTIWHNHNNLGDYSVNNTIVT